MDHLFPVDLTRVSSKHLQAWQDDEYLSPALRLKIGDELDKRLHALDERMRRSAPATSPEPDPDDPDADVREDPKEWEQWDREAQREVKFQDDTEGM
jgi:hypothetical protein